MIKQGITASFRIIANLCLLPGLRHLLWRVSGLDFGKDTFINMGLTIVDNYSNQVFIGNRVAIAPNVTIVTASNPNNSILGEQSRFVKSAPVEIGDDSWLGSQVVIMPGVKIGSRSIVAAGSVVTKDVANDTIVAGVPAKEIGTTIQ